MPVAKKVGRKKATRKARKVAKPKPARAKATKPPRLSVRAFARELDVSHTAVQKAIESGRLQKSVGRDARRRPFIADVDLARKEWAEGATKARNKGARSSTLVEVQTAVARERARGLRLANQMKEGETVLAAKVQRDAFEAARTVRDNVLNVPDRVSAELAGESDAGRVHARLSAELQLALETIAGILEGE